VSGDPKETIRSAVAAAAPVTDEDRFQGEDRGPAEAFDDGDQPPPPPDDVDWDLLRRCAAEPQNDIGNSRRFRHRFGHEVLHVQNIGWHVWDGRRWAEDVDARLSRPMAHKTVEAIALETLVIEPTDREKALIEAGESASKSLEAMDAKDPARAELRRAVGLAEEASANLKGRRSQRRRFANSSGNKGKLDGMLSELLAYVSIPIQDLDADPYALNTLTGTLRFIGEPDPECPDPDIVRVRWRVECFPHERMDRISKLCETEFDPTAAAPLFHVVLERILPNPEVRAYVRRYLGYGLLGTSREQVFALFHGEGANGKSTLVDVVARIMGSYATSLPIATLIGDTSKKGAEATPDLARLPGSRFVRTAEPKEGLPLNEDVIKTLTSSEPVPIRRLHQEFVDVYPVFTLVLSANRKPDIRGDNDGIWRRVHLVPFEVQIPEAERDKSLPDKLWAERAGILNWLIEGALDYLSQGLAAPPTVRAATDEYRAEMDLMGAFIRGALIVTRDPTDQESPGDLYKAFASYCAQQAQTVWREQTFSKRFAKAADRAGIEKAKASVVTYRGVRVRPEFSAHASPSRTHDDD
jgi:putative DNA primase/helicase